ncbi:General secretion pathway M protein [Thioalkalivibrio nitratireducens DSM 14787]|uniref:General secretion pathway M protein n=1 Tax=Thioalkalivibrio nitratireducens (strain DSM 14787 / UNIQEM 213 / ALEN2) TaxID=1255043 RepID=L0E2E2_THIND|nr:type II secretion system protein M [Thioalkalivibrio nitratireducens]AGA35458.1 General secretion pathway M protein [Thioalkalivibrio nitratireducens DSM 14787]
MKAWWDGLADRERRIVLLAALVGLLAGAFLFVLEPALERRELLADRLQQLVDEHAWMQAQAPAVRARAQTAGPVPTRPGGSPLGIVDVSARSAGLGAALRRVRPLESGVEAELEGAAYPALIRWLATLESGHGLQVISLGIDPGPEPGRVNVQLRVEPMTGRS